MKLGLVSLLCFASLHAIGCVVSSADESPAGVDESEDALTAFPQGVFTNAQSISYGQTLIGVPFEASALYTALKFQAADGDAVKATVAAAKRSSRLFLARKQGTAYVNVPVLAAAVSGTMSSAPLSAGEYFLVFRTAPRRDATFSVTLANVQPVANGTFGQTVGRDACLPGAGTAPAWVTKGRCNARNNHSPIVSAQTGLLARSADVFATANSYGYEGAPTFAADGTMFVNKRAMSAIDPDSLTTKWTRDVGATGAASIGPDGTLYAYGSNMNGAFLGVDPATGANLWTTAEYTYKPQMTVLPDGKIVSVSWDCAYRIDPAVRGSYARYCLPGYSLLRAPVVSTTGTMYLGTTTVVGAFATTGPSASSQALWSVPLAVDVMALDESSRRIYALRSDGGQSYVGSFSASDGQDQSWTPLSRATPNHSDIAVGDNGFVYFTDGDKLFGVDTVNHTEWQATIGDPSIAANRTGQRTPVVGGDGAVYVGSTIAGKLHAFGFEKTGALRFDTELPGAPENTIGHAYASIAPSGHLAMFFYASKRMYLLGP